MEKGSKRECKKNWLKKKEDHTPTDRRLRGLEERGSRDRCMRHYGLLVRLAVYVAW